jgi:glycosyltransferase involved in cell wall biosynthesis
MSDERELWVFTLYYPYGHLESYIGNELNVLSRYFSTIRVLPLVGEGEPRPMPPNAKLHTLFEGDHNEPLGAFDTLTEASRLIKVYRRCIREAPSRDVLKRRRREIISRVRHALQRERTLVDCMGPLFHPERTVLYSYWTSDWATVLALWKMRDPRVRFISRMHGFDMYGHRAPDGWQVFQPLQVEAADHFYLVASDGLKYIQERYPAHAGKFSLSSMATEDHGIGPWSPARELRVVSCSNLLPLKRVDLIAEALCHVQVPVKWTHFGDGPERVRIEAIIGRMPPHVDVELPGLLANADIIERYRREPFDVFVHMSRTEGGAPVAMQEAISFGIPLLGTDAGGTRDVLNGSTGITLPNDASSAQLTALLDGFQRSDLYTAAARQRGRAFWSERFDAEVVHTAFAQELIQR